MVIFKLQEEIFKEFLSKLNEIEQFPKKLIKDLENLLEKKNPTQKQITDIIIKATQNGNKD